MKGQRNFSIQMLKPFESKAFDLIACKYLPINASSTNEKDLFSSNSHVVLEELYRKNISVEQFKLSGMELIKKMFNFSGSEILYGI